MCRIVVPVVLQSTLLATIEFFTRSLALGVVPKHFPTTIHLTLALTSHPSGMVARRVGVEVAAVIRDIQEKYNQFVIFYQTGKLAYHSSKIWEQYDSRFAITQRTEEMKRRAMKRAAGGCVDTRSDRD